MKEFSTKTKVNIVILKNYTPEMSSEEMLSNLIFDGDMIQFDDCFFGDFIDKTPTIPSIVEFCLKNGWTAIINNKNV